MSLQENIRSMEPKEIVNRLEVRAVWDMGLLWCLSHRRSFRYPRGAGAELIRDGFFNYDEPKHEAVPLNEVELALLCWAGLGTNGLAYSENSLEMAFHMPTFEGRVVAFGGNQWSAELIFSHDDGVFLYTPHVPTKSLEIETVEDMEIIFKAFKEGITKLSDQPLRTETLPQLTLKELRGRAYKPGTTVFLPIAELVSREIDLLMVSANQSTPEERLLIIDDDTGKPAGIQKWIDNGYLKDAAVTTVSRFETGVLRSKIVSLGAISQNIQLCAAAMGLGAFPFGGSSIVAAGGGTPQSRGMGFSFASDKRGRRYPVGIDGLFTALMPPYVSIDEAVDAYCDAAFGPSGRLNPAVREGDEVVYRGYRPRPRAVHRPLKEPSKFAAASQEWKPKPEAVQLVKDYCNYVYDTYGRMPKTLDPFVLPVCTQVAHVDLGFYDRFFISGSVWKEQRDHLNNWHGTLPDRIEPVAESPENEQRIR